jgi:YVTN family beta-propeller protein
VSRIPAKALPLLLLTLLLAFPAARTAHAAGEAAKAPPASDNVAAARAPGSDNGVIRQETVQKNARIEFTLRPHHTATVVEGELAELTFRITDNTTGVPIPSLSPAAWLDKAEDPGAGGSLMKLSCQDKIKNFLGGTLGFTPLLDLSSYFVLGMNNDSTISVYDPVRGVSGITQLYTMVYLKRPGEDWAFDRDGKFLYVTMPKADAVSVVDLETFKIVRDVPVGDNPVRVASQPDGRYVWVALDAPKGKPGALVAIDPEKKEVAGRVPLGSGHHEIAFSDDSLVAFVTNEADGTLDVVDLQKKEKVRTLPVGGAAGGVSYSTQGKAAYAASGATGEVAVVDAKGREATSRIRLDPGISAVRFEPQGRYGFVINPALSKAYVLDAATNRVIHTVNTGEGPDQITFTKDFAYIRSRKTTWVSTVSLAALGKEDTLPVVNVQIGARPPADSPYRSVADAVYPAYLQGHTLIANPADAMLYYYMEGMNASMGGFKSVGGHVPRAVRLVDRTLKEREKGVYSSTIRIPVSGTIQLALFVNSPRVAHCFEFESAANPLFEKGKRPRIEYLLKDRNVVPGEPVPLRFRLFIAGTNTPVQDLKDVTVRALHSTGMPTYAFPAVHKGDGVYEATLSLKQPGFYRLLTSSAKGGIRAGDLDDFVVNAKRPLPKP